MSQGLLNFSKKCAYIFSFTVIGGKKSRLIYFKEPIEDIEEILEERKNYRFFEKNNKEKYFTA